MHILVIPSWYPTKNNPIFGIFFKEQAMALKEFGHNVGVIYPKRLSLRKFKPGRNILFRKIIKQNEAGIITIRSVAWRLFLKLDHANMRFLIKDGLYLYSKYEEEYGKPDIIHAHSCFLGGVIASKIEKKYKIPFIVTEHSTVFVRGMVRVWQKNYLKEVFAKTEKIITVSPQLGNLLYKKFECPESIIKFIPNMVDIDFFKSENVKITISKKFIFLTISLLTNKKGHNILIEAFAKKFSNNKNISLWIGGDGEEKNNLIKKVNELGIEDKVKFLGPLSRNEVRDVIRKCDVFVLPSIYETFGVVLAESMQRMVTKAKSFNPEEIRRDCIARFSKDTIIVKLNKLYMEVINNYVSK